MASPPSRPLPDDVWAYSTAVPAEAPKRPAGPVRTPEQEEALDAFLEWAYEGRRLPSDAELDRMFPDW